MIVMLMLKQGLLKEEEQKIYLCSLSSSRLVHILVNRFLCCLRSVSNLHRCLSNSSLRFLHGSPNNGEHVMMLSVPRPPFLDMELFLVGLDTARHGQEGEDWGISKHQKDFFSTAMILSDHWPKCADPCESPLWCGSWNNAQLWRNTLTLNTKLSGLKTHWKRWGAEFKQSVKGF